MAMFNLTNAQITELELLVNSKRGLPTGQKGLNQAYLKLAGYITAPNGGKLDGVGGSIWHFINAAANINKDGNDMATVTREYSAFQSAVRTGVDFDQTLYDKVQVASDDIAIAILDQVIKDSKRGEGLPLMSKIEEKDANPASRDLFAGDPGGWVGSPMFIFFGHDRAFKDYITDSIVNPITDPVNANGGSRGGYDMFAMVAATLFAVSKVATSQVSNPLQTLRDLVATIAGNDLGYVDKATILTSAVAEFDASLKKLYGDGITITGLGAAGILGVLAAGGDSSLVNKAGIILGTNKSGANEGDTITGSDLNDFIHAGRGDDTVLGGNGNDLIDGGDGKDFIDYSASAVPVRFTLKYLDVLKTRYGIEASKDSLVPSGLTGTDNLFNFEQFRGSMFGDTLTIKGLIADIPQRTSPTFPGLPKFFLDLFGSDASPAPLGRSMLPVSPNFGGDSIDASGGGTAESTGADGHYVRSHGVVIDLQNEDNQFAADEQGTLPTKLGLEGKFPIAGLSKQLEFYNLVYAEINQATDLTGYATVERLNLKNIESATGTDYNDLLIGADTVYKWEQPEPPAPTAEVPNPPMPPLKRVVDKDFRGADLIGGKGDDTIIIYNGGSDPAGGKDQVVFHKIDGGEGRDLIAINSAGKTQYTDAATGVISRSTIDGGAGDDAIFVLGKDGKGLQVYGGTGRDFIYVKSVGADVYGDTIDRLDPKTGAALNTIDPVTGASLDDKANADLFWFAPGVTVKDAGHHDVLSFFGMPLTGGNIAVGGALAEVFTSVAGIGGGTLALAGLASTAASGQGPFGGIFWDNLVPFITYIFDAKTNTLYVANMIDAVSGLLFGRENGAFNGTGQADDPTTQEDESQDLTGFMTIKNFDFWGSYRGDLQGSISGGYGDVKPVGTLNMVFKQVNPVAAILDLLPPTAIGFATQLAFGGGNPLIDATFTLLAASARLAKALKWADGSDPLVLDLDGNGIEFSELKNSRVYFDLDGDKFRERTAWLNGSDGFLAVDANGNGRIDDISELFGGVGVSGLGELAGYDSNHDGVVDALDAQWAELRVWRDLNQNGVTDAGELQTLEQTGIVSLTVTPVALDLTTPQGVYLSDYGSFTRTDGTTGRTFDAILPMDNVDTKYAGENGRAAWQQPLSVGGALLDAKGFGTVTNLAVAAANDIALGELATQTAAAMTVPKLKTLVAQAGAVLGAWGAAMPLTQELVAVRLGLDAHGATVLLDRAVYVEDATGGFWKLHSNAAVLDAQGNAIARATLEDIIAQGTDWQLEQAWSPSTRGTAVQHRDPAPYLVQIVAGRAVVLDHGVEQADGSWRLASGAPVLDASGNVIAAATRDDILHQAHAAGLEWRVEQIGFNPNANLPVAAIGVRFTDGHVVDYTVLVTDQDGAFYVWARNLDRALELEAKTGDSREFNLRNYEVDFANLDEVGSTVDSQYRVELLTPAQFQFAMSLGGLPFRSEMLTATLNNTTGHIAYTVNATEGASLSTVHYESEIKPLISLLEVAMQEYIIASRRFAVRLALQDGLSEYAIGLKYDAATDRYRPTTDRELAPMFEAIFRDAPITNTNDAVFDYLTDWNEILWQVYPDYSPSGKGNLLGGKLQIDQAFIFQMLLPAFETVGIALDIYAVAHALSIDDQTIRAASATSDANAGTDGTDFFYMTGTDLNYTGGAGSDYYFVGKTAHNDTIFEQDLGESDQLRFTDVKSTEVKASRIGQDLILTYHNGADTIRLTDQFLGELNPRLSNGKQFQSGVDSIVFADGVIWDRLRLSMQVVDTERAAGLFNDAMIGSGSADVLWGGKGNDFLSGSAGGDFYIYQRGDGQDVIDDQGALSFGPVKAGIDFLQFRSDITASDLKLTRDGQSSELRIVLLDKNGLETTDTILVKGQFGGMRLNLGIFSDALGGNAGLDYVAPNLIERFIFEDGTSLDFGEVAAQVIKNAQTVGDDAIYGLLNSNTLDGGTGNDYLSGRDGNDTYVFGRGYGHDVIEDTDYASSFFGPKDDFLEFKDDLRWTDFDYLRVGKSDTLTMRVTGTNDQVTLVNQLKEILFVGYVHLIENIKFADGTNWSYLKLLQHFIDVSQTDGNDTVYGFSGDLTPISDTLTGGLGDDRLEGGTGNDVYVIRRGDGQDTIFDDGGNDRLVFQGISTGEIEFSRTALDLIITITATGQRVVLENQYVRDNGQGFAVEHFEFADLSLLYSNFNPEDIDLVGTNAGETTTGSNFAETLDGRGGDDTLIGADGGDTYKFDVGYGHDVIIDQRVRAFWFDRPGVRIAVDDQVQFGPDITRANVVFSKDGLDLVISIIARDDTLRIRNHFRSLDDSIERFVFNDGTFLRDADVEQLLQITGGNRGDNTIEGSLNQPNTLDGRQGDDTLIGGNAADTYAFSTGYNFDRIIERPDQAGIIDRIVFGASVTTDALKFRRNADDLSIDLGNGRDVITIVGGLTATRVEQFEFADGSILTLDQVLDRMFAGSDADERLDGLDNRDDTISGGKGSDAMAGGQGDDNYKFGFGDGSDSILDTGGIDRIVFGPTVTQEQVHFRNVNGDLLITLATNGDRLVVLGGYNTTPVESFIFSDGTSLTIADIRTQIFAQQSHIGQDSVDLRDVGRASILEPGTGNDHVILAEGARVLIHAGDGIDRIEMPSGVTHATVQFADALSTQVFVRSSAQSSNDLILSFPLSGDQVVLFGALEGGAIPRIEFADGRAWDAATLIQHYLDDQSGAGDDIILGSARADTINPGRGDDQVQGDWGDDTYQFTIGDGHDVIEDASGTDTLKISGYQPSEMRVTVTAPGRDELLLSFGGGADTIILRYATNGHGVDAIVFGDGTRLTRDQLFARVNGAGTDRDDRLVGGVGTEVFTGGKGNDTLIGGGGDDTYKFNLGDGQDRIDNPATDGRGTLEFGTGITLANIDTTRDADGNLVLSIRGTSDRITLVDPTSTEFPVVANVRFVDGQTISTASLALGIAPTDGDDHIIVPASALNAGGGSGVVVDGGLGNDTLEAGRGADVLSGGKGNDRLLGKSGADTYFFDRGDGQDAIIDFEAFDAGKLDRLRFGAGISTDDIRIISAGPRDLVIGIAGSDDRLTIKDMFVAANAMADNGLEVFAFANGITWTLSDIYARIGTGSTGDDTIDLGTSLDIAATIAGGIGDDTLAGGYGDTTYVFNRGDGRDTIREGRDWWQSDDTLRLGTGIAPSDLVVTRDGDDYVLRFVGGDDRLTITGQATASNAPVDHVVFANTVTWSAADLAAHVVSGDAAERMLHPPVAGQDPFASSLFAGFVGGTGGGTPTSTTETLNTGVAPQTLAATAARDTWRFFVPLVADNASLTAITSFQSGDAGDALDIRVATGLAGKITAHQQGADTVIYFVAPGTTSLDNARVLARLVGVTATALTAANFGGAPYDVLTNKIITGTGILTGDLGNDTITGNNSADTITGGAGDDLLYGGAGNDTYTFSRGFGQDVISDAGNSTGDAIEFDATILSTDVSVSQAANGQDLILRVAGTGDQLSILWAVGFSGYIIDQVRFADATWSYVDLIAKSIVATDADQSLHASSSFGTVLSGGAGNDTLNGRNANDTLTGGTGNDKLYGGFGNDTYTFSRGFGQDVISDDGNSTGDEIVFDATIASTEVSVSQAANGQDLILRVAGTDDQISILWAVGYSGYIIDQVRFADATWSYADLIAKSIVATDADQSLHASSSFGTVLSGGAGNDTLNGRNANDTLTGGTGNDKLYGGFGNDTYKFSRGFGLDVISDDGNSTGDEIVFDATIASTEVSVSQAANGQDLILRVAGTGDQISILWAVGYSGYIIDQVRFADTTWSYADLIAKSIVATEADQSLYASSSFGTVLSGGAGNDTLNGRNASDTLTGGTGNDKLYGGFGNDTYTFSRGFGQDVISDDGNSTGDEIVFDATIASTEVSVSRAANGQDLVLRVAGTGDQISILWAVNYSGYVIDRVRFADNTVWSHTDLIAKANTQPPAADHVLTGGVGNDSLVSTAASEILRGGAGSDSYVFARGGGQDIVDEQTNSAGQTDTLVLHGYAPAELKLERDGNDLVLRFVGTTDEVRLVNGLSGSTNNDQLGVEQIVFDNGTVWDRAQFRALAPAAPLPAQWVAAPVVRGDGDDIIYRNVGSDTINFTRGDGNQFVTKPDGVGRIELHGYSPGEVHVSAAPWNSNLRVLTFDGSLDTFEFSNLGNTPNLEISFANGTVWSITDVETRYQASLVTVGEQATTAPGQTLTGGTGADSLYDNRGGATLVGGAGDDRLTAEGSFDTLIGGTGNDKLVAGNAANTTYVFARGDGRDTIAPAILGHGGKLVIHGYEPGEVSFGWSQETAGLIDGVLKFIGTTDQITIQGALSPSYDIENH